MDRSPQGRRDDPPQRSVYASRPQKVRTRRPLFFALAGVVVIALVAGGAYVLLHRGSQGAAGATGPTTPTSVAAVVTDVSGTTATGTAPADTTTADAGPLDTSPRSLEVETFPTGASLQITLQGGTTITGAAPYSQVIPGGRITVNATEDGYEPATRQLALEGNDAIKIWLDPQGQILQSIARFDCGKQPKQVLFTPDGKELWVAILGGGKTGLEAYDPVTGEQLAAINLGGHEGTELTMTKDGKTIFVSQMATSTIWEVDRASRKVVRHFKSGGSYTKILVLSPDEKTLYASNWKSSNVSVIDVATGTVERVIPVVDTPRGLYITPDSKYMYVSGFGKGQLEKVDLLTGKGTVIYDTGGAFRHIAVDMKKGLLYVGEFHENAIYVVDLATDKVRKLADTDHRPNTIDLSPDGKVLYVSNRGKDNPVTGYLTKGPEWGSVLAIDTATGKVLDAIVGGNQCTGLDVSPDGTMLAFSDFLDHTIRVYRIPPYATLAAGNGGRAVAHLKDIIKDPSASTSTTDTATSTTGDSSGD